MARIKLCLLSIAAAVTHDSSGTTYAFSMKQRCRRITFGFSERSIVSGGIHFAYAAKMAHNTLILSVFYPLTVSAVACLPIYAGRPDRRALTSKACIFPFLNFHAQSLDACFESMLNGNHGRDVRGCQCLKFCGIRSRVCFRVHRCIPF
jgi:hypothetical protein